MRRHMKTVESGIILTQSSTGPFEVTVKPTDSTDSLGSQWFLAAAPVMNSNQLCCIDAVLCH